MNQTQDTITPALISVRRALVALTVTIAIVFASTAVAVVAAATAPSGADPIVVRTGVHLEEDDPRWDCRVHGNQTCGPIG